MATNLPHETTNLFLTDGGLETTLVFLEGFELPCFAAFDLLKDKKGYTAFEQLLQAILAYCRKIKNRFHTRKPNLARQPRLDGDYRLSQFSHFRDKQKSHTTPCGFKK